MTNHPTNCKCELNKTRPNITGQQHGLDELMIVNPGPSGEQAVTLDDTGLLYEIVDQGTLEVTRDLGQYFLGDDGSIYRLEAVEPRSPTASLQHTTKTLGKNVAPEPKRYFLGADGALYEVVSD